ncbi:thioester domain-containing protein [Plantactinospora siamensis]|uniref:Thioester domain-containing protein n=1 Tax=Plantactinospora siamensis TaxID=555372 RepID=A0ABV6NPW3_9ACTN
MFGRTGARWGRTALAAIAGAALTFGVAGPAAAEPATEGRPVGLANSSVTLMLNEKPRQTSGFQLQIGDKAVIAYCIDFNTNIAMNEAYKEGTWDASEVQDLGKVQWVLTHGYPNVTEDKLLAAAGARMPGGLNADAQRKLLYFGTQTAVWQFSDGVKLGGFEAGKGLLDEDQYAVVQKIYTYLTENATAVPEPKPSLSIKPGKAADVPVGSKAGPFTVAGPGGEIKLDVQGGQAVDADGKQVTTTANGEKFWLTAEGAGTVSVTATGSGSVSTGRVFLHVGGKAQKLILGGAVGEQVKAQASANFVTGPASPTAAPSASPSGPSGPALPVTGSSTGLMVGAGLLLLVAGGVAVAIVRRRRVRFTV